MTNTITRSDVRTGTIRLFAGRKVEAKVAGNGLSDQSLEGIAAALDLSLPLTELVAAAEVAIAAVLAKRGSVIPNHYRYQYGADQSCGDAVAKALTALVTTPEGVDLTEARKVAAANDVEDRFDGWMVKGLNPGMVRMNLGNVLRGMARRGEEVVIGQTTFAGE